MQNLPRKGVSSDGMCPFCGEKESLEHTLLQCEWVSCVWFCIYGFRIKKEEMISVNQRLMQVLSQLSAKGSCKSEILCRLAFNMWYVWKGKCEALYRRANPQPEIGVHKCQEAISEYCKLSKLVGKKGSGTCKVESPCNLQKLAVGKVKINCDGAFSTGSREVGLGVLARDVHGQYIGDFGANISCKSTEET